MKDFYLLRNYLNTFIVPSAEIIAKDPIVIYQGCVVAFLTSLPLTSDSIVYKSPLKKEAQPKLVGNKKNLRFDLFIHLFFKGYTFRGQFSIIFFCVVVVVAVCGLVHDVETIFPLRYMLTTSRIIF